MLVVVAVLEALAMRVIVRRVSAVGSGGRSAIMAVLAAVPVAVPVAVRVAVRMGRLRLPRRPRELLLRVVPGGGGQERLDVVGDAPLRGAACRVRYSAYFL